MNDPLDNYPAEELAPVVDQIISAVIHDDAAAALDAITTAQQVGGHGWVTSLIFALATRAAGTADPDDKLTATEIFIADYTSMRAAGMKHKAIAATMGVSIDTLNIRLERNNCRIPEDDERVVVERMDRLIATGRAFTMNDLPFDADRSHITRAFNAAERQGRIVRAGTANGLTRNGSVVRWMPTQRIIESQLRSAS